MTAPLALVLVLARHARALPFFGDERPRRVYEFEAILRARRCRARARKKKLVKTQVCREVPWIMRTYWLEEVTTPAQLRSRLANEFRRASTTNPAVIDVMLFKGAQELVTVMAHHFQRHHLITKFVAPSPPARSSRKPPSRSPSSSRASSAASPPRRTGTTRTEGFFCRLRVRRVLGARAPTAARRARAV